MNLVVVGAGKMGLPLACVFADRGANVTVCDVKRDIVDLINAGKMPFMEPELDAILVRNVRDGRLRASLDLFTATAEADMVVVLVTATLTEKRDIDYGNLKAASREIARGLRRGTLVSYETTVAVGGVRSELVPILETSGLKAGKDFYVAFSPERVKSQFVVEKIQKTPKIVGGFDLASADRAETLYTKYLGVEVINVKTMEAAEFAKLSGMIYRDVNIALANEMAAYCEAMGLDFSAIREAANTDGESEMLQPGVGVGGHCVPVYPYFLINQAIKMGQPQLLATAGRQVNEEQPARHVARLGKVLGGLRWKRIHILGLGFRPAVKEHYCSPAFVLRDALLREGAQVSLEDPMYSESEILEHGFVSALVEKEALDGVVLNTAHPAFLSADFAAWRKRGVKVVLDGRNVWNRIAVESNGLVYLGVGRP